MRTKRNCEMAVEMISFPLQTMITKYYYVLQKFLDAGIQDVSTRIKVSL